MRVTSSASISGGGAEPGVEDAEPAAAEREAGEDVAQHARQPGEAPHGLSHPEAGEQQQAEEQQRARRDRILGKEIEHEGLPQALPLCASEGPGLATGRRGIRPAAAFSE